MSEVFIENEDFKGKDFSEGSLAKGIMKIVVLSIAFSRSRI